MSKNWKKNSSYDYDDEYEDDGFRKTGKKKPSPRKRPDRNFKDWNTNEEDEFHYVGERYVKT